MRERPLAAASARLQGRPGRPKKTRPDDPPPRDSVALAAVAVLEPRLLSVAGAAQYLGGISEDAVRAMIAAGHLTAIRLPGAARRVLLDRAALDRYIDRNTSS